MWTWTEIESQWLMSPPSTVTAGLPDRVVLGHPQDEVVAAFDLVEDRFGREWIEERRQEHSYVGILEIVRCGSLLRVLSGVGNSQKLVEKLKERTRSAESEAAAIYLFRQDMPHIEVEYEPEVSIGRRIAVPDFRVRSAPTGEWTYVEVASPDPSMVQEQTRNVLSRLGAIIPGSDTPIELVIDLLRLPTEGEVEELEGSLRSRSWSPSDHSEDLPNGLGRLVVKAGDGQTTSRRSTPSPSIVTTSVGMSNGEFQGRTTVSAAFTDPRAAQFLNSEARQLPRDAPGLVLLDVSRTIGGSSQWEAALSARLQPALHTRVSGFCLFEIFSTLSEGFVWGAAASYRENDHAGHRPPGWIGPVLKRWPSMQEVFAGQWQPRPPDVGIPLDGDHQ